jgi:hypothetical protein
MLSFLVGILRVVLRVALGGGVIILVYSKYSNRDKSTLG